MDFLLNNIKFFENIEIETTYLTRSFEIKKINIFTKIFYKFLSLFSMIWSLSILYSESVLTFTKTGSILIFNLVT